VKGKNAAQIKILTLQEMLKPIYFYFLLLIPFCHCSKNEATKPSFIRINQIDLALSNSNQGSSSAKISDAWIYINDQLLGAYELPCEIPVSNFGTAKISIAAGIKNTGQSTIRERYPFYSWYDTTITFNNGIYSLNPTVNYLESAQFNFVGDFESNNTYLVKEADSDTNIYKINANNFEGLGSGEITVNNSNVLGKVRSALNTTIPQGGKRVFLEMNYACNAPVISGVIVDAGNNDIHIPIITLSSTQMQWNKIYIDLTNTLAQANLQGKFEFYFEIQQISGEENKVRFDNIKLVSQK
jgi:hypothetical protein